MTGMTGVTVGARTSRGARSWGRAVAATAMAAVVLTGCSTTSGASAPSPSTHRSAPAAAASKPVSAATLSAAQRRVLGWTGHGKVVALTFDDGPGPYTAKVLDELNHAHVHATFCQIGDQISRWGSVDRRIVASGDGLCDHTWSHVENMSGMVRTHRMTQQQVQQQITRAARAITTASGLRPTWFRSPGGDWGTPVKVAAAREHLSLLGWGVDSRDWTTPGTTAIVRAVLQQVRPGAIILLHDAGGNRTQTVAAIPLIITALRHRGYTFESLPSPEG